MTTAISSSAGLAASNGSITVEGRKPEGQTGLFGDMLDTLNPLQHIPIVGQIYRSVTGDTASNQSRLAGKVVAGAAIAGPIGAAAGAGLFVVDKLFDGIGRLFGGGKTSAQPAVQARAPQAVPVPLAKAGAMPAGAVAGTATSGAAAASPALLPQARGTLPNLNSAQFTALMQSFGQSAAADQTRGAATLGSEQKRDEQDFSARMSENLRKLQDMKQVDTTAAP